MNFTYIFCLIVFSFWSILLTYKYIHFGYGNWDLAFFSQSMWNLTHGSFYSSIFDTNFFSNHANLIAFLILPIFKIFPHPMTLVLLKIISFSLAGYFLYLLLKENLSSTVTSLIIFLYFVYPPNLFGLFYEFDFEGLAPVFLMAAFYFYTKDRWIPFMLTAVMLIMIKENLPFVVIAFGLHGLFTKPDKIKWGITPTVLGVLSFYFLVFVFVPLMSGRAIGEAHPYYIASNYRQFGGSVPGILNAIFLKPQIVWAQITSPLNLDWVKSVLLPLGFLPIFSPGTIFLIFPLILQHLMSSSVTEHTIYYGYLLPISPFLFLAVGKVFVFIQKQSKACMYILLGVMVVCSVYSLSTFMPKIRTSFMRPQMKNLEMERWRLVNAVPADASIVASFPFLPQLALRKNVYPFHKIYSRKYQSGKKPYVLPSDVEYILIDFTDPWLRMALRTDEKFTRERLDNFFEGDKWIGVAYFKDMVLFKKDGI
jgi:uncharacterized membrane protein